MARALRSSSAQVRCVFSPSSASNESALTSGRWAARLRTISTSETASILGWERLWVTCSTRPFGPEGSLEVEQIGQLHGDGTVVLPTDPIEGRLRSVVNEVEIRPRPVRPVEDDVGPEVFLLFFLSPLDEGPGGEV